MSDKVEIKCSVIAKKCGNVRQVKHKAVAGITQEEVIAKHTIGELPSEEKDKEEDEESENNIEQD